ncbi:MAG: DUF4856 domain-containing protein, partial [Chitinophagales bacterium]|nr:DUF4856 domain-containing protein [Chitinophagales bacterium]
MKKLTFPLLLTIFILSIQSCKKDDNKSYDIPTTYNFSNVDYSGQTTRIKMIDVLVAEVRKGSTTQLNGPWLLDLYSNTNNPFPNDTLNLNTSGKKLKDKTFLTEQSVIENWLTEAATSSLSYTTTATAGNVGTLVNGANKILVDATGKEYKEAIEKGLQGALIYYQITAVYLSEDQIGAQVAIGDRQHHWDEAFGYYGVPVDYPTNTSGLKHVGKYCNDRNALLQNGTATMNAFLKGRAAINNNDNATVTEQVAIIRDNIERGWAGTAVHYINGALDAVGTGNAGGLHHNLSEGYFIIKALKYNPTKKVTDAQIQTLLSYFGTDFYSVTTTNLQAAKDLLSTIYGFDTV